LKPSNDTSLLHGAFRPLIQRLEVQLIDAGIPLRVYEAYRSPVRQALLYAKGRAGGYKDAKKVTNAKAWQSHHQYGLACDFVFLIDGKWTWAEPKPGMWRQFHQLAGQLGLQRLSFEMPHVQFAWPLAKLLGGLYPEGGGDEWEAHLGEAILSWGPIWRMEQGLSHPGAPPIRWPMACEWKSPIEDSAESR